MAEENNNNITHSYRRGDGVGGEGNDLYKLVA